MLIIMPDPSICIILQAISMLLCLIALIALALARKHSIFMKLKQALLKLLIEVLYS